MEKRLSPGDITQARDDDGDRTQSNLEESGFS